MSISATLKTRIQAIELLITDIDGIFNDGNIFYDAQGQEVMKAFHAHDSIGIQRLKAHTSIKLAVLSGRKSDIVMNRADFFGITDCYLGHLNKIEIFNQIAKKMQIPSEAIAYIGDDLPDLPCIQAAGVGASVPNAIESVKAQADWLTPRRGGEGAFRDFAELLIAHHG